MYLIIDSKAFSTSNENIIIAEFNILVLHTKNIVIVNFVLYFLPLISYWILFLFDLCVSPMLTYLWIFTLYLA